jgi:glycosyltransferase involved in cell wall biosynthesis
MKIALYNLTTTIKIGGVESLVWDVAQRLAEREHEVTLFGGKGPVSRQLPNVKVLRYPYIARESWGRVRPLRKSLNLLKLLERLSMAPAALPDLLRGSFDIVQVVKPYDFPIAARARARSGARFIYNSHGTDFFPGDVLFRRSIDGAFACSRYNAAMVATRYHIPIDVAYNGFDESLFRPLPPDQALRARYSPDGAPLLLYVGRLVTFKGLDHLLDAVAMLNGRMSPEALNSNANHSLAKAPRLPVRLILAGDGPHRAALQERANRLGLGGRVQFLGSVPHYEIPHLNAISDAFVVPSTDHETFCIAACEAMGCGRPVIATRVGGLPEVVRDGETGFLVPPGDAAALAERIAMLLGDGGLRQRMGEAARVSAEMFTWDRVIERMLASYEQALGRG